MRSGPRELVVQNLGIWAVECRVWGLGFRDLGFWALDLWIWAFGFRIWGFVPLSVGLRVWI